ASRKLPSRGLVMVDGVINDHKFQAPLEPDGQKGHWLKIDKTMLKIIGAKIGDAVKLEIEPSQHWPEPEIPTDLKKALDEDMEAKAVWDKTTPAARWDWIRSVRSTHNPETRARRIEVACSKLRGGKPRQCCFNRSECTDPAVSKGGILIEPSNN
ncbi:MAG: YdeI/OmpD-associated family protein, partial [Candidatus Saccharimonadales bacterium]